VLRHHSDRDAAYRAEAGDVFTAARYTAAAKHCTITCSSALAQLLRSSVLMRAWQCCLLEGVACFHCVAALLLLALQSLSCACTHHTDTAARLSLTTAYVHTLLTHCSRVRQPALVLAAPLSADSSQNLFAQSRSEQADGENVWISVKR
jgi:hypothetical protein